MYRINLERRRKRSHTYLIWYKETQPMKTLILRLKTVKQTCIHSCQSTPWQMNQTYLKQALCIQKTRMMQEQYYKSDQ